MPLKKSSSKKAREFNIKEMIAAGHKPDQAVAAAYSVQRKAEGKSKSKKKKK
jgi:ribosomal protein L12E/L44/L45/RPP1/RPP2